MSNKKFFRLTKFALIAIFSLIISVQSNSEKKFSNPENSSSSSSWAKLNISPDTLGSMKYGNYRVDIYEHSKNQNPNTPSNRHKYYYAPIALLDHKSAISAYNKVTKNPEMKFRIEMWNQNVTEEMVLHLNKILGRQVSEDQVEVIPLENVILVNLSPSSSFSLSTNWKAIRHHQDIWFTLSCLALKVCDQLAAEMRSKPEQFDHFKLLFSLSSQTSQTKQTVIRIETIASGQMVSDLLQKYGSETKEVFLTASDENRMLTETATNIRLDTFDETEVGSSNSEAQIYNMLKEMLISSKVTIKEQSDKMWESVFWNDDNYRPDKTTQTLNNVYKKMDKISQEKLADSYEHTAKENTTNEESHSESKENTSTNSKNVQETQSTNVGGNVLGSGWGLTEAGISANYGTSGESCDSQSNQQQDKSGWSNLIKTDFASDFSRHGSTSSEGLNKFHEESKDHVQWDGEKFVPKPMQLSRINLAKFRDTQSFQDKKVSVRYTTAVLSTPINFVKYAGLTVTDEWKNLKEELQGIKAEFFATKDLLRETREWTKWNAISTTKIREELTDTTKNLLATRKELEDTKTTFDSMRIELVDKWKNLKEELKATKDLLRETREWTTKIRGELTDTTKNLLATRKELEDTKTTFDSMGIELVDTVYDLRTKLNSRTSEIADIGKAPTSCWDLQRMGHKLNGFFSVKGRKNIRMVYCDFNATNQQDKQKWIGYVDVKSELVQFYVQRNSPFNTAKTPIPFDSAVVNEGNAMNLKTGIFTATRTGTYFISFAAVVEFPDKIPYSFCIIGLYLNGVSIGYSWVEESTVSYQRSPGSFQSTLKLKKGDQVWVQIEGASDRVYLFDYTERFTHFTGFLLEEEIVESI